MKTIVEQSPLFFKIFGEQSFKENKKYRIINTCICTVKDNGYLLLNTFSRELIYLSESEFCSFENIDVKSPIFKYLLKHWYFVETDFNEFVNIRSLFNISRSMRNENKIIHYLILPTTDCNARCFYCFERGIIPRYMTSKTAEDVADYIENTCDKSVKIKIRWFGGEPLCNINAIDTICQRLKEKQIDFYSDIISNGYLLNKEIIEKSKTLWNMFQIQITLDGTEAVYNRTKNYIYKDDPSPFKRVMNNIDMAIESGLFVKIRLNMDQHNCDDLYKLIPYIAERVKGKDNVGVYVHSLFEDKEKNIAVHTREERLLLSKKKLDLQNYMVDLGIMRRYTLNNDIRLHQCMADTDEAITISPEGNLGKCQHYDDNEMCGNIYEGITNKEIIKLFKEVSEPIEECKECPLYAYCYPKLKKCIGYMHKCENIDREIMINGFIRHMKTTYDKYIENERKED